MVGQVQSCVLVDPDRRFGRNRTRSEMGFTLLQLQYFVEIVDAGFSVTKAAECLSLSQPGLSKQLKNLERELGARMFLRRGKSLERLSPLGEAVAARVRVILSETATIRTLATHHRRYDPPVGCPSQIKA